MFAEPGPDLGGVVGSVVVTDEVHVEAGGHGLVDPHRELLELDRPLAAVQGRYDAAVGDVEGCEQAGSCGSLR
ncbi:hypothetical protein AB0D30_21800 [Streptomyces sp. NPDC048409]|uniref:hypothetical protein n=1 Tax=Streptomyces sp. NPDC048409 TaxID=3154723 RepID=UPI00344854EB